MDGLSITTVAGICAAVVVLTQVVDKLVGALINKNKICGLTATEKNAIFEMQETIHRLDDMHSKYDPDGTPLWYVPRSLAVTQGEMRDAMLKITHSQEIMSKTLEKAVAILDDMHRREDSKK